MPDSSERGETGGNSATLISRIVHPRSPGALLPLVAHRSNRAPSYLRVLSRHGASTLRENSE